MEVEQGRKLMNVQKQRRIYDERFYSKQRYTAT